MTLINCPECGHQVSDAAETCPSCGVRLSGESGRSQLELELTQIDLEWERDRHRYMGHNLYGRALPPKKATGVVFAVISAAIGTALGMLLVFGVDPVKNPQGPLIAMILAGFIFVVGVGGGLWEYRKAEAYDAAHAAYLRKREAALSKHERQADGQR